MNFAYCKTKLFVAIFAGEHLNICEYINCDDLKVK